MRSSEKNPVTMGQRAWTMGCLSSKTEGRNPPRCSTGAQTHRGQSGDTRSMPGGGRLDVREDAEGGQMDRSGHQASGECRGKMGVSVEAIGRADHLI